MPAAADLAYATSLWRELIDTSGRTDRAGLARITVGLLVLEAAIFLLGVSGMPLLAAKLLLAWVAYVQTVRRLKDAGYRGNVLGWGLLLLVAWPFAAAFALVLVAGPGVTVPGTIAFWLAAAAMLGPAAIALVWLHLAPSAGRSGTATAS